MFLIDANSGEEVQYKILNEKANSIGKLLKDFGFKKGDRITVLLDNSISTVYFYFGCLYCGISVVPVNSVMTRTEINHIIKNSNSKGIAVNEYTVDKFSPSLFDICLSNKGSPHFVLTLDFSKLPNVNTNSAFYPFLFALLRNLY